MGSWASDAMKVLLRVVLTLLLVVVGLKVGLAGRRRMPNAEPVVTGRTARDAWQIANGVWRMTGRPMDDAATVLREAPAVRKQLLPGAGDAEAPAPDIPIYPQSSCRMQVGHGTVCFTGFYLTPDSVEAVRSFYVRALGRLGWERVTAGRPGPLETFAKRDEDRTVVVQLRRQDSVTTRIGLVAMTAGSPCPNERK